MLCGPSTNPPPLEYTPTTGCCPVYAVVALLVLAAPALAQQSTTMTAVFDQWTLHCQSSAKTETAPARKTCEVNATLMAKTAPGFPEALTPDRMEP